MGLKLTPCSMLFSSHSWESSKALQKETARRTLTLGKPTIILPTFIKKKKTAPKTDAGYHK